MAFIFIKVAPYGSKYVRALKYYADLSAQLISPPLLSNAKSYIMEKVKASQLKGAKLIVSSPQKRALQTAKLLQKLYLPKIKIKKDKNLNEIPFSLDSLDEGTYSSTAARHKFLDDFIADKLIEKRAHIKARIMRVFDKYNGKGKTVFITHTFLMKVIQTLLIYPDLFKSPRKLKNNFDTSKRLFDYCSSFTLTRTDIKKATRFK